MKYIRTKDGIFDIEKLDGIRTIVKIYDVDESLRLKYENTNEPQQIGDRHVIIENKDYKITDNNTADTIEELCDEFVGVRFDNTACLGKIEYKHWFYEQTGWFRHVEFYKVIYGAIWTDKGLIYVAKMNESGVLELL